MPATAKVIPAKYVYESPTNTALGYQFCSNKLTVAAKKGAINNNENTCGPTTTFDVGSVKRLQTFRTMIPPAMTNDWPHSNPFKPAWMLIAFDKNRFHQVPVPGFLIAGFYEDDWGGDEPIDQFIKSFIAVRSIKPLT
mgnify:CR=1 FL=1